MANMFLESLLCLSGLTSYKDFIDIIQLQNSNIAEVAVAPLVNKGSPAMLEGVDQYVLQVIGFEAEEDKACIAHAGRIESF